jgi:acyl carrier protein phosphodiesterase
MNWLAHLHLARYDDAAMLGALLGDFAFGATGLERFGAIEHREILLHRRIDGFTDRHPDVAGLRARFAPGLRRYAGIALDVYFDHLLARDWTRWTAKDPSGAIPLEDFTARAYAILQARHDELPPRLQAIAPAMAAQDWLGNYRHRGSVDRAVTRIARRLSRNGDRLVACLDALRGIEPQAEQAFERFFPALVDFVDDQRSAPMR